MTLADDLKSVLYDARGIMGELGFRPHTVALFLTYSNATEIDGQALSTETTPITEANGQPPKIVWQKAEDVPDTSATASDTVVVGPVTPSFPGGGTDLDDLRGDLEDGVARYLLITGPRHPDGARYRILDVNADKALRYVIRAQAEKAALQGFYAPL
jgi:hypothetical protein